jgi:hypothetical protein
VHCRVHSEQHDGLQRAITETYASQCDGFLAASNDTDASLGAKNIWGHHNNTDNSSDDKKKNPSEFQKERLVWAHVHKHYLDDFDFFHLNGGNAYVFADNLRYLYRNTTSILHNRKYKASLLHSTLEDVCWPLETNDQKSYTVDVVRGMSSTEQPFPYL